MWVVRERQCKLLCGVNTVIGDQRKWGNFAAHLAGVDGNLRSLNLVRSTLVIHRQVHVEKDNRPIKQSRPAFPAEEMPLAVVAEGVNIKIGGP